MVVIVAVSCKEDVSVCGIVATGQVAELGAVDTTFSQESKQTGVDATTFSQESSQTGVEATTFSQESLQTGGGFNCINADHSITYSNLGCILRVQPSFFGLAGSGLRVRKCISPQLKKKVTSNSLTEKFYSKSL